MTTKTGCECELAGYCTRHNVKKHAHWHALCQNSPGYFRAWESGTGPGQRTIPDKPKIVPRKESVEAVGPRLWKELHTYNPPVWDANEAAAWFAEWFKRIPSFGCSCREHFRAIIREKPPDFSSPDAFFVWGVDRHNDVNRKLGKPLMSLADARKLYGRE